MTTYTKITDFASKDVLLVGNPLKLIRGVEIGAEFDAITQADSTNVKSTQMRLNPETLVWEGYNGYTWATLNGGAATSFLYENDVIAAASYTIHEGKNAFSVGPITIAPDVAVTVPVGSTWVIA